MVTVFFTSPMLIVNEALRKGSKFSQDHFIHSVLLWLMKEKRRFTRKNLGAAFLHHTHTSACHDGQKITSQLTHANILRAQHPPYWRGLTPCNFWLFGFLKESMKGVELRVRGVMTFWTAYIHGAPAEHETVSRIALIRRTDVI
jgi:hypothetical protein